MHRHLRLNALFTKNKKSLGFSKALFLSSGGIKIDFLV